MAIDTVPPLIAGQINYLLSHCPFSVKVEQMWSGCKNPSLLDRFTLIIPFCLDYIKWDVIYNAMYPLAAPDIIFGPEDESFQPYSGGTEKSSKNSLADWNSKDPSRLLSLIIELRNAYMSYQRKRIGEVDDERLKFEISTMLPREGIEMYLSSGTDKPEEVRFAVPLLDMDLNKLVAGSTWRHPQKICLQKIIFPIGKKYSTAPPARLKLISSVELKALFSIEDFRLPPWLDGMCTAEYLPTLEDMLGSQIEDAVASIESRRKFIMALAPLFGRPVEADPVFCRRATFLASSGVFSFLGMDNNVEPVVNSATRGGTYTVDYRADNQALTAVTNDLAVRRTELTHADTEVMNRVNLFNQASINLRNARWMADGLRSRVGGLEKKQNILTDKTALTRAPIDCPFFHLTTVPKAATSFNTSEFSASTIKRARTSFCRVEIRVVHENRPFCKIDAMQILVASYLQHFNSHGVPVKSPTITEYPWSPRWDPSKMAERLFEFLAGESFNFKKYCNQLNQQ
ncbi:hypothetical protein OROMI_030411 [Orobanche minor]